MAVRPPDRVSDLYHRALARAPEERGAFLVEACNGDEALRKEVESLLEFEAASARFLERPAGVVATDGTSVTSMIDRQIGSYTIVAPLGAGGMGEVYRARDSKLGRDVAIKILPAHFTADPERRARFAREARTLATLNHPHIGAIYGLEEVGDISALVLELVEGPTLAERLERGPLPIAQALAIARQIAEALEAAHEKGIVHRDLKPANIVMQTAANAAGVPSRDVCAKVLDFGLAKPMELDVAAGPTQGPSGSFDGTADGRILGTPAYMSPEQARGQAVDKRTDIWAFGCVLFEMLSGRRAFEGATITDTLARILERAPDWTRLPAKTPRSIRRLLDRCLRKDPTNRLRDIADALPDLEVAEADDDAAPAGSANRPLGLALLVGLAAGLLVSAVIAAALLRNRAAPVNPRQLTRLPLDSSTAPLLHDVEVDLQGERPFALSQDGRHLVYVGRREPTATPQLIVRALDQESPVPLPDTSGARSAFFSPDGQWIGFCASDGTWKKTPRTGGRPEPLWRLASSNSGGGTWLSDGDVVLAGVMPAAGLVKVPAAGGDATVLTRPGPGEQYHSNPSALPGGRGVLYAIERRDNVEADLAVLDLTSGRSKTLIRGSGYAEYVDPGYLIYSVPGALRAQRFDVQRLEATGEPTTLVDGLRSRRAGEGAFSTSRNGTLVYSPGVSDAERRRSILWVDRSGHEQRVGTSLRAYAHPRLSPDDSKLAVAARDERADIWLWDFNRATDFSKITSGPASDINPVWLPDGEQLLVGSRDESAVSQVVQVRADGAGGVRRLTSGNDNLWPISVTPDGTAAVAVVLPTGGTMYLATIRLDGDRRQEPLIARPARVINGELSPDGRWLAYQSSETAREEIFVSPFPEVDSRKIPVGAGIQPVWCRSGKELFYLDSDGYLTAVTVDTSAGVRPGVPRRVLQRRYSGTGLGRTFDVSRDCQRFLMLNDEDTVPTDTPLRMVVMFDWVEELRRRLPLEE